MLGTVVVVAFQIIFYVEIYINDEFLFFKIIFYNSILKRSKIYIEYIQISCQNDPYIDYTQRGCFYECGSY
jgi:hypothetical protein